jgi:hypothetical protein
VLLKSAGADTRGFVAKVSDFGLSVRMDPSETHVSNMYQVRPAAAHREYYVYSLGRFSTYSGSW